MPALTPKGKDKIIEISDEAKLRSPGNESNFQFKNV